ncbi:hypothetical protein RFI_15359 [Reticulomyxa filosa]|uniref:Up-regulated in Daf-2 domain-containing protein n=1 Tax=Reticulomyxa filosa TaxID=46433 RepID=X6N7W3_RETFI|nr:hypothetical protein RFI_15359 [Reticulomyxa filosa]|eukprot:ETO21844.1 hypothetical protein RFI_15359 [Reticulomyxa filosa]
MWTLAGEKNIQDSRNALKRCFEIFYRDGINETENNNKPIALFYCLYEQRFRYINRQRLPNHVFVVEDLNETLSFEHVVQQAKQLFQGMFPDEQFLVPTADEAFEAMREEIPESVDDDEAGNEQGSTTQPTDQQNELETNTKFKFDLTQIILYEKKKKKQKWHLFLYDSFVHALFLVFVNNFAYDLHMRRIKVIITKEEEKAKKLEGHPDWIRNKYFIRGFGYFSLQIVSNTVFFLTMGNGTSCSTTVRVKNQFGEDLKEVTVKHRFRADGAIQQYTWCNVRDGATTNASLRVDYAVGFGAMSDYDWWRVVFVDKYDATYYIDPYYCSNGYKCCFLTEEDQRGPVTIKINSNYYDGQIFYFFLLVFKFQNKLVCFF